MIETYSQAFTGDALLDNTIWGSSQDGGSSGGPLIVNLGRRPKLRGKRLGKEANFNRIVGVTSWGYDGSSINELGASRFTRDVMRPLVAAACALTPDPC